MALRNNPDAITYETRPEYLKNQVTGRVFIATDALIDRGDMIAVDKNGNEPGKEKPFNYKKATKQQIVNAAKENFDVELSVDDKLKDLRASYAELIDKADNDAGDNSDSSISS